MKSLYQILLLSALSVLYGTSFSQITTTPISPVNAVGNVLIGGGISASAVSFTGNPVALAEFTANPAYIGMGHGLLMSSGDANNPLLNGPSSNFCSSGNGMPGDALLDNIAPLTTYDAVVLQFDFTPLGDTLKFKYVFGSEEYNEYVGSNFNDAFAFFLSGPNPAGGNYTNFNVALIPGSGSIVSINNVNNGSSCPSSGPCNNCAYFVDNCTGNQPIAPDAYTVVLTAIAPVVACSTYTIRLSLADAGDSGFDSFVFLEAGSFISPHIVINSNVNVGGIDTIMHEGCSDATLQFIRNYDTNLVKTYTLQLSGNAVSGVDFVPLPQTITFQAGQDTAYLNVQSLFNQPSLIDHTLTITITDTICSNGGTITSTLSFDIKNVNPLTLDMGPPNIWTCDTVNILPIITGGVYPYIYNWNNGLNTDSSIVNYVIGVDTVFNLTVHDQCASQISGIVNADLIPPPTVGFDISEFPLGKTLGNESCGNFQAVVTRQYFTNLFRQYPIWISGTAANGTDYTVNTTVSFGPGQNSDTLDISPIYDLIPEGTEYLTLMTIDTLCNGTLVKDSVRFYIKNVDPIALVVSPNVSTGCPPLPQVVSATASAGSTPYTYLWNTGDVTSTVNVAPQSTAVYNITVTDSCGRTISGTTTVDVFFPPIADFNYTTTPDWCAPTLVKYLDQSNPVSGLITDWAWSLDNSDSSDIQNPTEFYLNAGTYNIALTVTNSFNCSDTVFKQITVFPKPNANFVFSPNDPTVLLPTVVFNDLSSTDVVSWTWNFYNWEVITLQNPVYTFDAAGYFDVTLYVVNQYGCSDTAVQTIFVNEDVAIFIPNSFTPNNDDMNETFNVLGTNIDYREMRIFSRWGEEIFYSNDKNIGWNGRLSNGNLHKNDVYTYRVFARDKYGKEYVYNGHLSLVGGK